MDPISSVLGIILLVWFFGLIFLFLNSIFED